MAKDIAPELFNAIDKDFDAAVKLNRKIHRISSKIEAGTATYVDMYYYSQEIGKCLSEAFKKHLKSDNLPDGRLYYNIAERVVRPMLEKVDVIIAEACNQVQNELNAKAGLGVKAV